MLVAGRSAALRCAALLSDAVDSAPWWQAPRTHPPGGGMAVKASASDKEAEEDGEAPAGAGATASTGASAGSADDQASVEAAIATACATDGDKDEAAPQSTTPTIDPSLAPPAPSRADWCAEVSAIRKLLEEPDTPEEEKIRVLHEALVQRIEDTRGQEGSKAVGVRRLDEAAKERDRCRTEVNRAQAAKTKLEGSCRELQQQKANIAKENQRIAEEEQGRHTELKDKFQQAIKDVQEKMDAELEVRQHFLRENEELRGKLLKFTETYEAQERQLAEQRESRSREMEVAQQRLKEHETMCSESKTKTASLEKQNEVLRKSQTVLRDELQTILGKFDEFHEAVTGSNQRHGDCKVEIDTLQSKLQDLEKENSDLRNNVQLTQVTEEQKVAQKQRDALERLCENLQKENKKVQEQLQSGKR